MKGEPLERALEAEFGCEQIAEARKILEHYRGKPGSLIPVLEDLQGITGYLPPSLQQWVATRLNVPKARVYGVVTFYSFFTMVPRGRHTIRMCLGTACYVRGSKRTLQELCSRLGIHPGETTQDRRFSLETVRCLGACGLAPAMVVDNDTFAQVKPAHLEGILKGYE